MSLDVYLEEIKPVDVYHGNITHNLNQMAIIAGVYDYLWNPETYKITQASELIKPLQDGLKKLKASPNYFRKMNPINGWGTYEDLITFMEDYLQACIQNPLAKVKVCR